MREPRSHTPPKKTARVEGTTRGGYQAPTSNTCHMSAHNVIEREHPASDAEFAAVAVFAALAFETDTKGSALPPLWPMLLHFFSDFAPPTGTAAESLGVSCIPQLIRALRSPLLRHQHGGAFGMRKVLSHRKLPPIGAAIAAGAVPLLAKLLENDDNPVTQSEAAWALTNIACDTTDHTACIVNTPGLISSFVRLLASAEHNVCEQAVWVLGSIAGDRSAHRDLLVDHGVIPQLIDILTGLEAPEIPLTLRRSVMRTISNLFRGKPAPPLNAIASVIPCLAAMIQYPDGEVVANAMWSLWYICDRNNDGILAVLAYGALPAIMHLVSNSAAYSSWDLATPTLRCLCNIVSTGGDHYVAVAVQHGAIRALCTALRAQTRCLWSDKKEEILLALSNIAAGNAPQINALLQAGVFDLIAEYVTSDHYQLRKPSQLTIANALQGASPADRTAIIGSASFRALLSAASTASSHRNGPAVVEGLETALALANDTVPSRRWF
jgi:hypothetical protein